MLGRTLLPITWPQLPHPTSSTSYECFFCSAPSSCYWWAALLACAFRTSHSGASDPPPIGLPPPWIWSGGTIFFAGSSTLCATTRVPGTGHFTSYNTLGKDITYVAVPPPFLIDPPFLRDAYAMDTCHVGLKVIRRHCYYWVCVLILLEIHNSLIFQIVRILAGVAFWRPPEFSPCSSQFPSGVVHWNSSFLIPILGNIT